jgi:hypothetical protein
MCIRDGSDGLQMYTTRPLRQQFVDTARYSTLHRVAVALTSVVKAIQGVVRLLDIRAACVAAVTAAVKAAAMQREQC